MRLFRRRQAKPRRDRQQELPAEEFHVGSVVVEVWQRRSRSGRGYVELSIGRWRTTPKSMWVSRFLYKSDVDDLLEAIYRTKEAFERK